MKRMYGFLSQGFAGFAVALVIVSVMAMPISGMRADEPPPPPPPPPPLCGDCADTGYPTDDCPFQCTKGGGPCPTCCFSPSGCQATS